MKSIIKFFNREQNLLIHFIVAIVVIIFSILFNISYIEWVLIISMIAFVITAELFNSAIEITVDLYTKKFNALAMIAKDTAAAAVLVSAITAAFVGLYVFLPKVMNLFSN